MHFIIYKITYSFCLKKKCINEYEIGPQIGFGSFGKVKKVTRKFEEDGIV